MKRTLYLLSILAVLLLAACSESPTPAVSTPVPTTQAPPTAAPTDTAAPTATHTPAATATATLTPPPTDTPTQAATATAALDPRLIDGAPQDFLLQHSDLPASGQFFQPGGSINSQRNEQILTIWGQENGQAYLDATGRQAAWMTRFYRGSRGVRAPEYVFSTVIQFATPAGARLAVQEWNPAVAAWQQEGWELVEREIEDLGDSYVVLTRSEQRTATRTLVYYRIDFSYHNYQVITEVRGWNNDVDPQFVEDAARAVLARLQEAELVEP